MIVPKLYFSLCNACNIITEKWQDYFSPITFNPAVFYGVKWPGTEADISFPSTVEVKRRGYISPLPTHLYDVHIDNCIFASVCTESFGGDYVQCW